MEVHLPDFTRDQIERARATLAQPDPRLSPAHRAMKERIARHVLSGAERQRGAKIIPFPRCIFQAGFRAEKLDVIDGGKTGGRT